MAKVVDKVFKSYSNNQARIFETLDSVFVGGHRYLKTDYSLVSNCFADGYVPVANRVYLSSSTSTYRQWYFESRADLLLSIPVNLSYRISSSSDYNTMYESSSYRFILYSLPLFLYKSLDFAKRNFATPSGELLVVQDAISKVPQTGYVFMFSYVNLSFNENKNVSSFTINRDYVLVGTTSTNLTALFTYPILPNGSSLPYSFGIFDVNNGSCRLAGLDGDYSAFKAPQNLPMVINCPAYPIPFYEDDSYIYAICDTVSMKQPFYVKFDKATKTWNMVTGYSAGSSVVQQQLVSVPNRPQLGDDNQYHWYKFVYDAVEDADGNVTYVPKFVYGSLDITTDAIQYDDCTVDLIPDDLKLGDDDTIKQNIAIVDLNVVTDANGNKYLMAWTYNYEIRTEGDGSGLIPDEKRKCYLFKIDSNDPKSLTYVGEKQLPSPTVWVVPLLSKDTDEYFVVLNNSRLVVCRLTFDSNVFNEVSYLTLEEATGIIAFGFDSNKRLNAYWVNSDNQVGFYCVYDDNIPEFIDISFEKDYYDEVPVDTYLTISVSDYLKQYVNCEVKLRILTDNAVFSDNNSNTIVVNLTSDNQPLNVGLTINKQGRVIVKVEYIRVT